MLENRLRSFPSFPTRTRRSRGKIDMIHNFNIVGMNLILIVNECSIRTICVSFKINMSVNQKDPTMQ